MLKLRSFNSYDTDKASDEAGLTCLDVSLAQQHQRDEADINTIVRRFGLTGQLPENNRMPTYGDFTDITDYQSALNAVKLADQTFMTLPADLRSRFGNNPEMYIDFCLDANNAEELIKLGLAVRKEPLIENGPKAGLKEEVKTP